MDDLRLLQNYIKMEYQKIKNFLDTTCDNVLRFVTKIGSKFMISQCGHTILTSKEDLKHQR